MSAGSARDALADVRRAYHSLPPGIWHVVAAVTHGELSFALGDDETAMALFAEGAAEAKVAGATALEATCRANLAAAYGWAGDWASAVPLARAARELIREHGLEQMPTQVLVTAMGSLAEAISGRPEAAHADWLLTRHNLANFTGVAACRTVQSYLALARTSLLLNDPASARSLLDAAASQLRTQADAVRPRAQIAELEGLVRAANEAGSWGRPPFTKAELRVLHYLPTNLTLAQIALQLYISHNTAKTHVASIYRKLDTTSRSQAVDLARTSGILPFGVDHPRP
jgi:LuxR family maltose regulon positive regulatory protein